MTLFKKNSKINSCYFYILLLHDHLQAIIEDN